MGIFFIIICMLTRRYYVFKIMNLLASFAIGGFNPYAAAVGTGSMVLFALIWLIAGPNYNKIDPDA